MKKLMILVVLLVVSGSLGITYWYRSGTSRTTLRFAKVQRGDILMTISATGTVEPEEVVDVGAQVAGKIEYFGKDPSGKTIDYGSMVEEDTILAHIDDSLYRSDMEQSSAQVEQAKANVLRAQADLVQMKAKLDQAENNWTRAKELGPSRALSATDYDSYKAAYETAKATVIVGEATIVQAQKSVVQAEAALRRAQTNLGYCTIKSPVKGIIVDRRVNIGQTVVSSLNAPSLFLIAKDLRKMEVWTSVNEADIGSIYEGQPVSFTVDAFPGRTFHGKVGKVRLNASMNQNVVTYTVEIHTDNSDGKLLPYLTANVLFQVAERKNVLTVPNAALRWSPSSLSQVAPEARKELTIGEPQPKGPSTRSAVSETAKPPGTPSRRTVWVKDESFVRPLDVKAGLTDRAVTEVQGDNLTEGTEVVVGEAEQGAADEAVSPFTPRFFRGRPR